MKIIISESQISGKVTEAMASVHYKERIDTRLSQLDLDNIEKSYISMKLNDIAKTKYNINNSYAIRILKFNVKKDSDAYLEDRGKGYYRVYDDKGKSSIGDELWVIVRQNRATTFFLSKSSQTRNPQRTKSFMRTDEEIY